jgi:hypothetical protein
MRTFIVALVLASLGLIQAGCAADIHAGPRHGGVDAGAAVGQPVYVPPPAP